MDLLSVQDLRALIEHPDSPCVSIYMPAHRAEVDREDPIRLRNLLAQARTMLDESGHRRLKSHGFFDLPNRLLVDGGFWRNQCDGLAIFLSPSLSVAYRLPVKFQPLVVATDHFHVNPIMPLFYGDGQFYVLAVSQNKVRLLQCRRHTYGEVALPADFVSSLQEAMRFYDFEESIQFHTGTPPAGPGAERAGVFHSQGTGTDEAIHKKRILEYFQRVDDGISRLLAGHSAPLVMAGVDFLHPIYRQANSYGHLLEAGVVGNPDRLSAQELHEQAWQLVQPLFDRRLRESLATFGTPGPERTPTELHRILPAAVEGRVQTLFVAANEHQWGTYDHAARTIQLHEGEQPGDEDLLDLAAMHTFLHHGSAYVLDRSQVPRGAVVAAVLRPAGAPAAAKPRAAEARQ